MPDKNIIDESQVGAFHNHSGPVENISETEESRTTSSGNVSLDNIEEKIEEKQVHALLFMILGNSGLFTFNLIINAIDIFIEFTGNERIGTLLSQASNIPSTISTILLVFLKPHNIKPLHFTAIGICCAIMIAMALLFVFKIESGVAYWVILVLVGLSGFFSQAQFTLNFVLAGQFTPKSVGWVSSGTGMCGVLAFILRIITKSIFSNIKYSAILYFSVGALIIALTIVYYSVTLCRCPDVKAASLIVKQGDVKTSIFSKRTIEVVKKIWYHMLAIFFCFLVTLSIFPGYLSSAPRNYGIGSWTPIIVTSIFCLFDWVGRTIPSYFMFPKNQKFAWIPIALRLLFFPIFVLSLQGIIKVGEPFWTFAWDVLFALTNGYCGTVVTIYGNSVEFERAEDQELASILMTLSLSMGIFTAMFVAMGIPAPVH